MDTTQIRFYRVYIDNVTTSKFHPNRVPRPLLALASSSEPPPARHSHWHFQGRLRYPEGLGGNLQQRVPCPFPRAGVPKQPGSQNSFPREEKIVIPEMVVLLLFLFLQFQYPPPSPLSSGIFQKGANAFHGRRKAREEYPPPIIFLSQVG